MAEVKQVLHPLATRVGVREVVLLGSSRGEEGTIDVLVGEVRSAAQAVGEKEEEARFAAGEISVAARIQGEREVEVVVSRSKILAGAMAAEQEGGMEGIVVVSYYGELVKDFYVSGGGHCSLQHFLSQQLNISSHLWIIFTLHRIWLWRRGVWGRGLRWPWSSPSQ